MLAHEELECQDLVALLHKYRGSGTDKRAQYVELEEFKRLVVRHPIPVHQDLDALASRIRDQWRGPSAMRNTKNCVI